MNEEEKRKIQQQVAQSKGQLEASINKVEEHLNREEFEDYCDAMATCTTYMTKIQKRIKDITTNDKDSF